MEKWKGRITVSSEHRSLRRWVRWSAINKIRRTMMNRFVGKRWARQCRNWVRGVSRTLGGDVTQELDIYGWSFGKRPCWGNRFGSRPHWGQCKRWQQGATKGNDQESEEKETEDESYSGSIVPHSHTAASLPATVSARSSHHSDLPVRWRLCLPALYSTSSRARPWTINLYIRQCWTNAQLIAGQWMNVNVN